MDRPWTRFAGTSVHQDKARAELIASRHAAAYPSFEFQARPASTGGWFIAARRIAVIGRPQVQL